MKSGISGIRVLHAVKTADGAAWAAALAACLHKAGVEVHVALPTDRGVVANAWKTAGAIIHVEDLGLPIRRPWQLSEFCARAKRLVDRIQPSLIHSHFFSTTMLLRKALGSDCSIPLIFQVPGPLHLENFWFREWDLRSSRKADYWIASSRCIAAHYERSGVTPEKLFLSYYGMHVGAIATRRTELLRKQLGISSRQRVVGSICHIYGPKYYLGQRRGLKNHETMIKALAEVVRQRSDVTGVLAGGPWAGAERYFARLQKMAHQLGKGRILMPGALPASTARLSWADYDCVVHIPASENCGGVIEPLAAGVPVVAACVGGLPEVIIDGRTGIIIDPAAGPAETARAILGVLEDPTHHGRLAQTGARLINRMFNVERTAAEVHQIYKHILSSGQYTAPQAFDSMSALAELEEDRVSA